MGVRVSQEAEFLVRGTCTPLLPLNEVMIVSLEDKVPEDYDTRKLFKKRCVGYNFRTFGLGHKWPHDYWTEKEFTESVRTCDDCRVVYDQYSRTMYKRSELKERRDDDEKPV